MGDGPWQKAAIPKKERRQLEDPQTVRSYPGRLGSGGTDLEGEGTTGTTGTTKVGTERQRWLFGNATRRECSLFFLAPINVASNPFYAPFFVASSLAILPSIRYTLLPLPEHSSIV